MPLKVVVDNLETEVEDEALRSLYQETEIKDAAGKPKKVFVLQIEGVESHPTVRNLKVAHENVKREKSQLTTRVTELEGQVGELPEGYTKERWDELVSIAEAAQNDDGNRDVAKKLQDQKAALDGQWQRKLDQAVAKVTKERDDAVSERDTERGGRRADTIDRQLGKAMGEAGITDPDLAEAAAAMIRGHVEVVDDDGQLRVLSKAEFGGDDVVSYVKTWAGTDKGKKFVTKAAGGDATGGGPKVDSKDNPWSAVHWNMTSQGRIRAADPAKADRLAKLAGHKAAVGARKEQAK